MSAASQNDETKGAVVKITAQLDGQLSKEKIAALNVRLVAAVRQGVDDTCGSLQVQVTRLQKEIEGNKKVLEEAIQRSKAAEKLLGERGLSLGTQNRITELRQQLEDAQKENYRLSADLQSSNQKNRELKAEITNLNNKITELQKGLNDLVAKAERPVEPKTEPSEKIVGTNLATIEKENYDFVELCLTLAEETEIETMQELILDLIQSIKKEKDELVRSWKLQKLIQTHKNSLSGTRVIIDYLDLV